MPYIEKTLTLKIPDNYEFVDYRPAKTGEKYISPMENGVPLVFTWQSKPNTGIKVFIVKERAKPQTLDIHPINHGQISYYNEIMVIDKHKNVHRVQVLDFKSYWDTVKMQYIDLEDNFYTGWYPVPHYNFKEKENA